MGAPEGVGSSDGDGPRRRRRGASLMGSWKLKNTLITVAQLYCCSCHALQL